MVWNFKNRNINMYFLSQKKNHAGVTVFDHSLHSLVCNINLMLFHRYRDAVNWYKYQDPPASHWR